MKIIRIFVISIFVLSFSVADWAQAARKAENFTAVTLDGRTVELASLRGKVVLLVFWSSRCSICLAEIPRLNEIAAEYSRKNIVFLAATMENEGIIESFLRRQRFDFQILPDSFGLMLKYSDRDKVGRVGISFPAYYVIDRSGYIQFKDSGWDKTTALAGAINRTIASR